MKFTIKLNSIKSIEQIDGYWNKDDYYNLLELFDYPDARSIPDSELFEMFSMAMTDFEPPEAAEIVLSYKLSGKLNKGQIHNLSHDMLEDKVAEDYSDISLHYPLFNINQLLYKAYNGKFPKTLASVIDIEITFKDKVEITKEIIIRTLSDMLSDRSLLKRLYNEKLDSDDELTDANSIVWELKNIGENRYEFITSDYWINNEDFELDEFSGEISEDEIFHTK